MEGEGTARPPGTCPGTGAALRGAGTDALALLGASLLFEAAQVGGAVRELGVGVRLCGADETVLGSGDVATFGVARARLAVSSRRREAGEPGRRCARRGRWLAPVGGRPSLALWGSVGAVTGRGRAEAVREVQGPDGLGHFEDGSGQTGLLGCDAGPFGDGLSFSLEAGLGSRGAEDGVRALRWSPGLSTCREETTGLEGSEE